MEMHLFWHGRTTKTRSILFMKKHLLLLSSIALSVFAMGQSNISFGIRAGVVNADMRGNAVQSFQNVLSFANGAITTQNRSGFYAGGYSRRYFGVQKVGVS